MHIFGGGNTKRKYVKFKILSLFFFFLTARNTDDFYLFICVCDTDLSFPELSALSIYYAHTEEKN